MKWLASFLAIIVLFLSVQPVCAASASPAQVDACCADDACEEQRSDIPKEKDCKGCNPFQSCACCAVAVIVPFLGFTPLAIVNFPASYEWSSHLPHFPSAVYGDFWQPPKLA